MMVMEEKMVLMLWLLAETVAGRGRRDTSSGLIGVGVESSDPHPPASLQTLPPTQEASPSRFPPQGRLSKMRLYIHRGLREISSLAAGYTGRRGSALVQAESPALFFFFFFFFFPPLSPFFLLFVCSEEMQLRCSHSTSECIDQMFRNLSPVPRCRVGIELITALGESSFNHSSATHHIDFIGDKLVGLYSLKPSSNLR
jgi:hypothetical protein